MSLIDVSKRVYTCTSKEFSPDPEAGDAMYWCKPCKDSTEHKYKRVRVRGQAGFPFQIDMTNVDKDNLTATQKQQYLD